MSDQPEPLLVGEMEVLAGRGKAWTRCIRLASVPGLAVTEARGRPGSWIVTHAESGFAVLPGDGTTSYGAPWSEAIRYMLALAGLPVDWTAPANKLGVRDADMPPLGPGFVAFNDIVTMRTCPERHV